MNKLMEQGQRLCGGSPIPPGAKRDAPLELLAADGRVRTLLPYFESPPAQ